MDWGARSLGGIRGRCLAWLNASGILGTVGGGGGEAECSALLRRPNRDAVCLLIRQRQLRGRRAKVEK